jgi:hypothetical protein
MFGFSLKELVDRVRDLQGKAKHFEKEAEDAKRELQLLQSGSDSHSDKAYQMEGQLKQTKARYPLPPFFPLTLPRACLLEMRVFECFCSCMCG